MWQILEIFWGFPPDPGRGKQSPLQPPAGAPFEPLPLDPPTPNQYSGATNALIYTSQVLFAPISKSHRGLLIGVICIIMFHLPKLGCKTFNR